MSAEARRPEPAISKHANDNVAGTITPDDRPFFLALALACAAVAGLAIYVAFSGTPDDVMAVLRR